MTGQVPLMVNPADGRKYSVAVHKFTDELEKNNQEEDEEEEEEEGEEDGNEREDKHELRDIENVSVDGLRINRGREGGNGIRYTTLVRDITTTKTPTTTTSTADEDRRLVARARRAVRKRLLVVTEVLESGNVKGPEDEIHLVRLMREHAAFLRD